MDEIESQTTNLLKEVGTGFSTPSSSSLDTCDSGFTEMYSSNLSLINSTVAHNKLPATILSDATVNTALSHIQPTLGVDSIGKTDIQIDSNSLTTAEISNNFSARLTQTSFHHSQNGVDQSNDFKIMGKNETKYNLNRTEADEDDIDNFDDVDSISSDMSDLSDAFKLNSEITPEMQRSINWVQSQISSGVSPRDCLSRIFINNLKSHIPEDISDNDLWRIIAVILSDPPRRQRLEHIKTVEDVCQAIAKSNNIIVLTGAGVSVSCGIPDFRSRDGVYERLRVEYPDMRDPQSMFDIVYFAQDPRPFFQFAREIYPGQFQPSLSHQFIKLLEKKGKLLRNYTQNIDTLERVAGIENVIECHGSFATASCTRCKIQVDAGAIQEDIMQQRIPMCMICNSSEDKHPGLPHGMERPLNYSHLVAAGIMKPDIVFFGESLPEKFHSTIELDKTKCDLLIVIGSSLKVRPVALIPNSIAPLIPQILINRENLNQFSFDVKLLGDSDVIINQLCHILGSDWTEITAGPSLTLTTDLDSDRAKEIMSNKIDSEYKSTTKITEASEYTENKIEMDGEENNVETAALSAEQTHSAPISNDEPVKEPSTALTSSSLTLTESEIDVKSVENTATKASEPSPSEASTSSEILKCDSNVVDSAQTNTTVQQQKTIEIQLQEETIQRNLQDFLPDDCYFYDSKNCYIFPGAESWWNLNESDDDDNSDSMSSMDSDDNDDFETYADTDVTPENYSNQTPDMFSQETQFNNDVEGIPSHNISFNHSEVNNCLFSQISNNQNDSSHAQSMNDELNFNKLNNIKQYNNVSQLESNYTTTTTISSEMRVDPDNNELKIDVLDKLIEEAEKFESTSELQKELITPCVKKDFEAFKLNDEHSRDSYEIAQKRRKYSM